VLSVRGLSKSFGGFLAINQVSFEVAEGEILGLIGPNGSGKSTTFNLVTGVLTSSGGTISVLGRKIDNAPPQEVTKLGIARIVSHVALRPVRRFAGYPESLFTRKPAS